MAYSTFGLGLPELRCLLRLTFPPFPRFQTLALIESCGSVAASAHSLRTKSFYDFEARSHCTSPSILAERPEGSTGGSNAIAALSRTVSSSSSQGALYRLKGA